MPAATAAPTESSPSPASSTDADLRRLWPSEAELRRSAYASLCFLAAAAAFAPLWWHLTAVQRQPLPSQQIQRLRHRQPIVSLQVRVVCLDAWYEPQDLGRLQRELSDLLVPAGRSKRRRVQLHYSVTVRAASAKEADSLRSAASADEFEESVRARRSVDGLDFYLLPSGSNLVPGAGQVRQSGVVFLKMQQQQQQQQQQLSDIRDKIERLLTRVLLEADSLDEAFASASSSSSSSSLSSSPTPPSRDTQRQAPAAPAYDIVLSLVHSEPAADRRLTWDVEEGVRLYLDPFLSRLSRYINVSVRSQILHHVEFDTPPAATPDADGWRAYEDRHLPSLVNSLERHVAASGVSDNPALHLVAYVPPRRHSPLRLRSGGAGFVAARWGGVYFYNPAAWPAGAHAVNMSDVMSALLPQLKSLLGLRRQVPRIYLPLQAPPAHSHVTDWELRTWLRRRCLESCARAAVALGSLLNLLDNVVNMVISERVADEAAAAAAALELAYDNLRRGGLSEAFVASKAALRSAEAAFFDHSLLELLYFPQDQKYAVYVPYFLPVGVSVLLSAFGAVRLLRLKARKEKAE